MRLLVMPLFLFSGTFFPVVAAARPASSRSPGSSPLWHGVELARALALGRDPTGPWLVHVAVLVGFLAVGIALSVASFRRRLHR